MTAKKPTLELAYRESRDSLLKFIRGLLTQPEDAEDALQEAFLRAYQKERSTPISEPRAFLFKTARNLSLNELSKRRTHRTDTMTECNAEIPSDPRATPEQRVEIKEQLDFALAAVEQLSPRVREVIILRKVHGLKQREIATYLGISESTVEKHIAKGVLSIDSYFHGGKKP